jgi:cell division transport system ATP-binding protein
MSQISTRTLGKHYPGSRQTSSALSHIDLDIEAGEMVLVAGRSGAGKSTLLKLFAAIESPTSGALLINGQNLAALRASALPYMRRSIGFVFQDQKLLFDRSALANVLLPLDIGGVARKDGIRRAQAALDKVGLLDRQHAEPAALSGGEQQRLAIARAVVNRPAILLADEPTANLDAESADNLMRLFRDFHRVDTTVIVATHDAALAQQLTARLIILDGGRVISDQVRPPR